MPELRRRTFLKGTLASGVLAVAAGSGLLHPARVLAAQWPQSAFDAKSVANSLSKLYGDASMADSGDITIKAPLQAENGAKVPITVLSSLPDVESIDILVKENVQPLSSHAKLADAAPFFSTRVKMAKSSDVHAVVKSGGKLYKATMKIKVTVGGCGG